MDGKLNEYLYEVDEECHERIELLAEEMKAGAGITEELKASNQMKWVGLMNNVRSAAEEIVIRELMRKHGEVFLKNTFQNQIMPYILSWIALIMYMIICMKR